MSERWMLYLDRKYSAGPWPWPDRTFADIEAPDLAVLPYAIDDFTCHSPSDGPIAMCCVPRNMPHEAPSCTTRMAIYHDAESIYVFIDAQKPETSIPELVDHVEEGMSIVFSFGREGRGLYFGLNQLGEAIGCAQIWSHDLQPEGVANEWPFSLKNDNPGEGLTFSGSGILESGYSTRVIPTESGVVGCFKIDRETLGPAIDDNRFPFSAGRRCYATGELLAWGACAIWSPRPDRHGDVVLVDIVEEPRLPRLYRVDLVYDSHAETGRFEAFWPGGTSPKGIKSKEKLERAAVMRKATLELNGVEESVALDSVTSAEFAIPDGWNHLELRSLVAQSTVVDFQKFSGNRIVPSRVDAVAMPAMDEIAAAFSNWHENHEKVVVGKGIWALDGKKKKCLCHDGMFHMAPYIYAIRNLGHNPVYEERIRQTCARMLAHQKPEGWFPCYCARVDDVEPQVNDGGAFTNGSVGEGLVEASAVLDEEVWLEAAVKAADYSWYRSEHNQNYAAFALWHLAALQEHLPREEWIEKGAYYARHFASRDINPGGAQDGHNFYSGYGYITLKGLARFLSVLPERHEYYPVLRDKVIRFANQMLFRQQSSGLFSSCTGQGQQMVMPSLFFVADALPELVDDLIPAIAAMMRAVVDIHNAPGCEDSNAGNGLTLAIGAGFPPARRVH